MNKTASEERWGKEGSLIKGRFEKRIADEETEITVYTQLF